MTPKVRTNVVYIQQGSRDNILRLRRSALHLQDAAVELPAELGELHAAVAECLQISKRLQQAVENTFDSDELAKFKTLHIELLAKTSSPTSSWSKNLQQQTREFIKETPITSDGRLHFKHPTQGYAYLKVEELCNSRLSMYCKPNAEKLWFDDVDALLQAGWAID